MLSHHAPGKNRVSDIPLEALLLQRRSKSDGIACVTLGRHKRADIPLRSERSRSRASRMHGVFSLDSLGALRFTDLSAHGTVFLPASGAIRVLQPRRHTLMLVGDAIAIGMLTDAASRDAVHAKMHVYTLEAPCRAVQRETSPAPSLPDSLVAACGCPVCHEPLRGSRVIPCGHSFCDDCLTWWFREHDTCPMCRATCDTAIRSTAGVPCLQLDRLARDIASEAGDARALDRLKGYEKLHGVIAHQNKLDVIG